LIKVTIAIIVIFTNYGGLGKLLIYFRIFGSLIDFTFCYAAFNAGYALLSLSFT